MVGSAGCWRSLLYYSHPLFGLPIGVLVVLGSSRSKCGIAFVWSDSVVRTVRPRQYFTMVAGWWLMSGRDWSCITAVCILQCHVSLDTIGQSFCLTSNDLSILNAFKMFRASVGRPIIASRQWGRLDTYLQWPVSTRYSNIFSNSARCSSHRPARSAWMHRSRIIIISMYISHSFVVGDVHVLLNSANVIGVTSSNAEVFSTLFCDRASMSSSVAGQWKQSLTPLHAFHVQCLWTGIHAP